MKRLIAVYSMPWASATNCQDSFAHFYDNTIDDNMFFMLTSTWSDWIQYDTQRTAQWFLYNEIYSL